MVWAHNLAATSHDDVFEKWVVTSRQVGFSLPDSSIPSTIQSLGWLDMILQEMEENYISIEDRTSDNAQIGLHILSELSNVWVCNAYEIVRVLIARWKKMEVEINEEIITLAFHLRLIRIPLGKHEFPKHQKQTVEMHMKIFPDGETVSFYSSDDPRRSANLSTGINKFQGSQQWLVTDVITDKNNPSSYILDRREISDRILTLLNHEADDNDSSSAPDSDV